MPKLHVHAAGLSYPVRTILANPHNLCYLHALTQALLWIHEARASERNLEFGDVHPMLRSLLGSGATVQLHRRKVWLALLEDWVNFQQQYDAAKLLSYIVGKLRFPAAAGAWEARTMNGPQHHIHQRVTHIPHIMLPCKPHRNLQDLVEQWGYDQDTGQGYAISRLPTCLCIQLLRFHGGTGGETNKLTHAVPLVPKLQIPVFTEGIETQPQLQLCITLDAHQTQATIARWE